MKYVLQVAGNIGEPSWQCDIHAESDAAARQCVEQYAEHSKVIAISHRVTLWRGDYPVQSWNVSASTTIEAEPQRTRQVRAKFQTEVKP